MSVNLCVCVCMQLRACVCMWVVLCDMSTELSEEACLGKQQWCHMFRNIVFT